MSKEIIVQIKNSPGCIALKTYGDYEDLKTIQEVLNMPKRYIDGRMGYARKFNYCPDCGDKIDWKDIRSNLNKVIKIKEGVIKC